MCCNALGIASPSHRAAIHSVRCSMGITKSSPTSLGLEFRDKGDFSQLKGRSVLVVEVAPGEMYQVPNSAVDPTGILFSVVGYC